MRFGTTPRTDAAHFNGRLRGHKPNLGPGLTALAAGMLATERPFLSLAAMVILILTLLLLRHPWLTEHLALVAAFAALPAWVPTVIQVGGFGINLYDPFIVLALARLLRRRPSISAGPGVSGSVAMSSFALSLLGGVMVGVWRFAELGRILRDGRSLVTMLAVVVVAVAALKDGRGRSLLNTIYGITVTSAVITVTASTFGFSLTGRSEAAQLYASSGGLLGETVAAARYLTPTSGLSMLLIAALVSALLSGRQLSRLEVLTLVAAAVIAFFSYSRYQFIGVATGCTFAVVTTIVNKGRNVGVVFRRVALILVLIGVTGLVLAAFDPQVSYVDRQVQAFNDRVVAGLSPATRARDSSAQDRSDEDQYLRRAIGEHPFVGSGLGYAYKPASGHLGQFANTDGRYYAHNFYLWVWLKLGLLGLVSFTMLLGTAFLRATWAALAWVPVGAALAALSIALVVAPYPEGTANAVAAGLLIGVGCAASRKPSRQHAEAARFTRRPKSHRAMSVPAELMSIPNATR